MLALKTALALTATLAVPSSAALPAGWHSQTRIQKQSGPDSLRSLRVDVKRLEQEYLHRSRPQEVLDGCDAIVAKLIEHRPSAQSEEAFAEWINVVAGIRGVRTQCLRYGATNADREVAKWWEEIEDLLFPPSVDGEEDFSSSRDIDEEIMSNAVSGNYSFIEQIGARAAPGVLHALRVSKEEHYASPKKDPLYMLMKIDPVAADQFVAEKLAAGAPSLFWELRFARAVAESRPFHSDVAWMPRTGARAETTLKNIAGYCDELILKPELTQPLSTALRPFSERGVFTPGMVALLKQDNEQGKDWGPGSQGAWLDSRWPLTQIRDLLLDSLDSTNAKLASMALGRIASNEGVYPAILAAEASIRKEGVWWLRERRVHVVESTAAGSKATSMTWTPAYGEAEATFLGALLTDEDPEVRSDVLHDLDKIERVESTRELAGWPEYGVEPKLVEEKLFPIQLSEEVLTSLAGSLIENEYRPLAELAESLPHDQVAAILRAVRVQSGSMRRASVVPLFRGLDWFGRTDDCIALARNVLPDADLSWALSSRRYLEAVSKGLRHEEGLVAITDWAIESGNWDLASIIYFVDGGFRPQLAALPTDRWVRLASLMASVGSSRRPAGGSESRVDLRGVFQARTDAAAQAAAFQAAAGWEDLSPQIRFNILNSPHTKDLSAAITGFHKVFLSKQWDDRIGADSSPTAREISKALSRHYTPEFRRALSNELMTKGVCTPELLGQIFRRTDALPMTPAVIDYAIAHTDELRMEISLVDAVLQWMRDHPEDARIDWIGKCIDDQDFTGTALNTAETLRHPDLLPRIAVIIDGPATHPNYEDAVRALKGYLTDESAALLLTAARKTSSEDTRTWCLSQVERIAALQDAEDRWATRRVKQATRETTVSKLMGLLGDADQDVRIEAIKGLATWEAVEAMPELIALLKGGDPKVVEAARAALDRLNERL